MNPMKYSGLLLISVLTLSAVNAQARVKASQLTDIRLDKRIAKVDSSSQILSGEITVDKVRKTAGILVSKSARCRPMLPCPKYNTVVLMESFKVISVEKARACGETIITAVEDRSNAGGAYKELVITDNSTRFCEPRVAVAPVEAEYRTELRGKAGVLTTLSRFGGEALQ